MSKTAPNIIQLADDLSFLRDLPEESRDAALDEVMRSEENQLKNKVDSYIYLIELSDKTAEYLREEAKQLAAQAKAAENFTGWLSGRLKAAMIMLGEKAIFGRWKKLTTQAVAPKIDLKIDLNDENMQFMVEKINQAYPGMVEEKVTTTYSFNRGMILELAKQGGESIEALYTLSVDSIIIAIVRPNEAFKISQLSQKDIRDRFHAEG